MNFIEDAFARMELSKLRSFLLYGTDEFADEVQPYQKTLTEGVEPINARLNAAFTNSTERDEAAADLNKALLAYEYVHTEIGMKAGARLVYQLLLTENAPRLDEKG